MDSIFILINPPRRFSFLVLLAFALHFQRRTTAKGTAGKPKSSTGLSPPVVAFGLSHLCLFVVVVVFVVFVIVVAFLAPFGLDERPSESINSKAINPEIHKPIKD